MLTISEQMTVILQEFRKNNFLKYQSSFNSENIKVNTSNMKVYHYCRARDWEGITTGSYYVGAIPGLHAGYRLCKSVQLEEFNIGAVFAFLEPLPKDCMDNRYFGELAWQTNSMGNVLLEIELNPNTDNAFVCDRAYKEGYYYSDKTGIPQEYTFYSLLEAEQAYVRNKIPLRDYILKKDELDYLMPEVVVTHDVPLDRIKVSKFQPIIEAKLARYKGAIPEVEFSDIRRIPELTEWIRDYKKRTNFKIIKNEIDIRDFFGVA